MGVSNNQAWVTSATCDGDVQRALIVCRSLRSVNTTRSIAVLVSEAVAKHLRDALHMEFDLVVILEKHQNSGSIPEEDYAKVYGIFALRTYEMCAYVSPFSIFLQNCDEIFQTAFNTDFMLPETNLSIFTFRPSINNFSFLMSGHSTYANRHVDISSYIRKLMQDSTTDGIPFLDAKYSVELTSEKDLLLNEQNIAIIHFSETCYPTDKSETIDNFESEFGILGKLVVIYWKKLLEMDVNSKMANTVSTLAPIRDTRLLDKEPIAIVGTSLRLPLSNNIHEFWDILINGRDAVGKPTPCRGENWKEFSSYNAGFLKTPIEEVDAKFFGMSPNDALAIDPQIRLLHEVVWEALEDAGIDPFSLRNTSAGVFVGSWSSEYMNILAKSNDVGGFRQYMGSALSTAAARLAFFLGIVGPCMSVDSACSSSLIAIHVACRSLLCGETNMALVCGTNLLVKPYDKQGWTMVIAPDEHCKTFSADADGYGKAEGCVALVLKRYSDAIKDGDRIWALVKGTAMAQEGLSNSFGTPTVYTESLVMKKALADARLLPEQVDLIEAHGTGTAVGDPIEMAAISNTYGTPGRKTPLFVGTVKTNIGHAESCSGMAGVLKVILSMHHEIIPPHLNFTRINPAINLEAIPAIIPLKATKWPRNSDRPRIAGVTSFGMTGTEGHVILEESPIAETRKPLEIPEEFVKERPLQILKLSARSKEALNNLVERYCEYVKTTSFEVERIENIAFSTNSGRSDMLHRAVVLAADKEELAKNLKSRRFATGVAKRMEGDAAAKICFLFTGQGSHPGMAKSIYETSPVFRIHFDYCHKLLATKHGISIKQALWESEDSETQLTFNSTMYSQTSIFIVGYALWKLWQSWGIQPDCVLGHSLGEFCAAVCAGYISVEAALTIVVERSKLIETLPKGAMLLVNADNGQVTAQLNAFSETDHTKVLDIAAINSEDQTVVAGDTHLVEEFAQFLQEQSISYSILPTNHAFHSHHMNPILETYRRTVKKLLSSSDCKPTNISYISALLGRLVVSQNEMDENYWVSHTREAVNFLGASQQVIEQGCRIFIEIGPQPVLSALTLANCNNQLGKTVLCLPSLHPKKEDWNVLLSSLGKLYLEGVSIKWKHLDMFRHRSKVSLPHYPFERKRFWPSQNNEQNAHPLIGVPFKNATPTKIFHNAGLRLEKEEYLKDHRIGQTIVFPGASYLEMCVAAFKSITNANNDSEDFKIIQVENLSIEAPFKLQESVDTILQTVLEPLHSINSFNVKVHRMMDKQWVLHSHATISTSECEPLHPAYRSETLMDVVADLEESNTELLEECYKEYESLGLIFGKKFHNVDQCWRLSEYEIITRVKYPVEETSEYVVHPIVLDAILQTFVLLRYEIGQLTKIPVPKKIGRFRLFSNINAISAKESIYVHVIGEPSTQNGVNAGLQGLENYSAFLLDSKGNVLAIMDGVEFAETTAKTVQSVLKQQERICQTTDTWDEDWQEQLGLAQKPVALNILKEALPSVANFEATFYSKCNENADFTSTNNKLNQLVYWYILKAFHECGWIQNEVGSNIKLSEMFTQLEIDNQLRRQFDYFLTILESEGGIQIDSQKESFTILKPIPSLAVTNSLLTGATWMSDLIKNFQSTLLVTKIGENLSQILKGVQPALAYLFPTEDRSENSNLNDIPSAKLLYGDYGKLCKFSDMANYVLTSWLETYKAILDSKSEQVFRVLEIGAGTGSYTQEMLNAFAKTGVTFHYCYTDISSTFFDGARKMFKKFGNLMSFRKLNIEEDPLAQNFIPEYYDLILAGDVIHATKDLRQTLYNVNLLLKPNGIFHLYETIQVSKFITFIFGLLEGYWRYEDYELRINHCTLSQNAWVTLLEQCGFNVSSTYPYGNNYHALISSVKTKGICEICKDQKAFCRGPLNTWLVFYLEQCDVSDYLTNQLMSLYNARRRIILVERGTRFEMDQHESIERIFINEKLSKDVEKLFDYVKSYNLEGILYCWGLDTRLTHQDNVLLPYFHLVKCVTNLKQRPAPKLVLLTSGAVSCQEKSEFWHPPNSTLVGLTRNLQNECPELPSKIIEVGEITEQTGNDLKRSLFYELWNWDNQQHEQLAYWEGTRHIRKLQPSSHRMSNLDLPLPRFQVRLQSKSLKDLKAVALPEFNLEANEIETKVLAVAQPNFVNMLSLYKQEEEFKNTTEDSGFDFAGIVTKVGSKVTKWKVGDKVFGMKSTNLFLPSHVKQSEDSLLALPNSLTVVEACTISTTASCISVHCLQDVLKVTKDDTIIIHTAADCVGISAIQICQNIGCKIICTERSKRKLLFLKGLGVEHLLNSSSANFVSNIQQITGTKGVTAGLSTRNSEFFKRVTFKIFAPGARYVQLNKLSNWTQEEISQFRPDITYTFVNTSAIASSENYKTLQQVDLLIKSGVIRPIAYTRFQAKNVQDAFLYWEMPNNVSKVICVMPENKRGPNEELISHSPLFNDQSTYLVTGGLGGIGWEVGKWMVEMGAKHVVLAGRHPPSNLLANDIAQFNLKTLANITVAQLDVSNYSQCYNLIHNKIYKEWKFPPLRGVMHAAGALNDQLLAKHTWETYCQTFQAKIYGTENLDKATSSLALEHFVIFSSIVAVLGGASGQSNHAAANCYEDVFAHHRTHLGKPTITINWGQWSEAGVAVDKDIPGFRPLSNQEALLALEYCLNSNRTQNILMNLESVAVAAKLMPQLRHIIDIPYLTLAGAQQNASTNGLVDSEQFWCEYENLANTKEKVVFIRKLVTRVLKNLLRMDEKDEFSEELEFQNMGVDSLMFIEMKGELQAHFGTRVLLNANDVRDFNTVTRLTNNLIKIIDGKRAELENE